MADNSACGIGPTRFKMKGIQAFIYLETKKFKSYWEFQSGPDSVIIIIVTFSVAFCFN